MEGLEGPPWGRPCSGRAWAGAGSGQGWLRLERRGQIGVPGAGEGPTGNFNLEIYLSCFFPFLPCMKIQSKVGEGESSSHQRTVGGPSVRGKGKH